LTFIGVISAGFGALGHVVIVEIAVLAHTFSVVHLVRVLALGCKARTAEQVVTVVAHPLCVVLQFSMGTPSHTLHFALSFLFDFNLSLTFLYFLFGLFLC